MSLINPNMGFFRYFVLMNRMSGVCLCWHVCVFWCAECPCWWDMCLWEHVWFWLWHCVCMCFCVVYQLVGWLWVQRTLARVALQCVDYFLPYIVMAGHVVSPVVAGGQQCSSLLAPLSHTKTRPQALLVGITWISAQIRATSMPERNHNN